MTLAQVTALNRYWSDQPPVAVALNAIGSFLGIENKRHAAPAADDGSLDDDLQFLGQFT